MLMAGLKLSLIKGLESDVQVNSFAWFISSFSLNVSDQAEPMHGPIPIIHWKRKCSLGQAACQDNECNAGLVLAEGRRCSRSTDLNDLAATDATRTAST